MLSVQFINGVAHPILRNNLAGRFLICLVLYCTVPHLEGLLGDELIHSNSQQFTRQATGSAFIEVNNYGSSPHPFTSSSLLHGVARSHSASFNKQAVTMNITTPPPPNRNDTPSTLFRPSSMDTAALPIGSAANGSSLWHSILDTYGKEILKCASHEFLDLAIAMRLKTINTRERTIQG